MTEVASFVQCFSLHFPKVYFNPTEIQTKCLYFNRFDTSITFNIIKISSSTNDTQKLRIGANTKWLCCRHVCLKFRILPSYTTIPSIPNRNQTTQYQRGKDAKLALEVGVPKHYYFGKLETTHFAAKFQIIENFKTFNC